MNTEEFIIKYLSEKLDVPVSGEVPNPLIESFVTVEQTGSRTENHLYHPTLAIQSWAESRAKARALNEKVKNAMAAAIFCPEISRCALDTDYNFPDLELKHPRYQAIFAITFLG